jgi:hypothetical protein
LKKTGTFRREENAYETHYAQQIGCIGRNFLRLHGRRDSGQRDGGGKQNILEGNRGAGGSLLLPSSVSLLV